MYKSVVKRLVSHLDVISFKWLAAVVIAHVNRTVNYYCTVVVTFVVVVD